MSINYQPITYIQEEDIRTLSSVSYDLVDLHVDLGNVSPNAKPFIDDEGNKISPFILLKSDFVNNHRNIFTFTRTILFYVRNMLHSCT